MIVALISKDDNLAQLFAEVLREAAPSTDFRCLAPGHNPAAADLVVWDVLPGSGFPKDLDFDRNILLVDRKELSASRNHLPSTAITILLKPLTRPALLVFWQQLGERLAAMEDPKVDSLLADRDELLQCLLKANLTLQEYDQDRTNFLARAVHDFKAPLTALHGYCGMLLDQRVGRLSSEQLDLLRRMQVSIKRLSRMTAAMFELSVKHSVDRSPTLKPGEVEPNVHQAVYEVLPVAQEKSIEISVRLEPQEGAIALDEGKIQQVLVNLLDNACKFTPRRGWIVVRGYPVFWNGLDSGGPGRRVPDAIPSQRESANAYRVDVQDSGPGIREEYLDTVFEEYTSYSGGRDRSGGGLGLAICRMILRGHRGLIWADSQANGCTISFVLPALSGKAERTGTVPAETAV